MVSVTKADGTPVTRRTNTTETTFTASATSLFSGTIEATSAYTVKVSKVDTKTLNPVAGAVYVITDPDGNTVEVTTDEEGHAVSPQFDEKYAGKEFKIKEKTAPEGYELDETEYTVTLGQNESILHVKDTPKEEEATTTTTTTEETTVTTVEEPTTTTTVEELPNTGTGNQTIYMVIGALLVVAAVGVLVFAKKKDSDEDK